MIHKIPTETHLRTWNPAGDAFGRQKLAERVVENILTKMETPNVLGIYGDWGTGKTTFLHYLQMVITGKQKNEQEEEADIGNKELDDFRASFKGDLDKVEVIHFEPWKYEYAKDADLLFALLDCINEKLDVKDESWKHVGSAVVDISRDALKEIAYSFFRNKIGVDFAEVFQKLGMSIDKARIEKFGEFLPEYEAWFSQFNNLQKLFGTFIDTGLAKQQKEKLIIFIDDLDRCLPENTIKLLEAMKNFLYQKNVIFVLALDHRVVSEMIEKSYGLHDGYGSEYLDKIVGIQIFIPRTDKLSLLVDDIFQVHGFKVTDGAKKSIVSFLSKFAYQPRKLKKILRQALIRCALYPSPNFSWNENEKIQYAVFAELLIHLFPSSFSRSFSETRNTFSKYAQYSKASKLSGNEAVASNLFSLLDNDLKRRISEFEAILEVSFFDHARSDGIARFDENALLRIMGCLKYFE
jgi:energy-coupling factor transporter ATP-binding protein EcfA2